MTYDELTERMRGGTYHDIVDASYVGKCEAEGCESATDIGFESPDDKGMVAVFTCEHHAEKVISEL